jgi:hypothetical protein
LSGGGSHDRAVVRVDATPLGGQQSKGKTSPAAAATTAKTAPSRMEPAGQKVRESFRRSGSSPRPAIRRPAPYATWSSSRRPQSTDSTSSVSAKKPRQNAGVWHSRKPHGHHMVGPLYSSTSCLTPLTSGASIGSTRASVAMSHPPVAAVARI